VDPARNDRFIGDEFNGIDSFPFASSALNRLAVCDALLDLATTLLQDRDVRLYSAEAWAKYQGAADCEQNLHRDYLNRTILVPSEAPQFQQVEFFVFLSDVTVELGAPRMVARSSAGSRRGDPTVHQDQLEPPGDALPGQVLQHRLTGPVLMEAGTTSAPTGSPVTSTATTRLAPLVRP
jgi:ectoine hydroxylase-related dioxygenase (phytanoyl-CoA dioxygenase family)